MNSLIPYLDFFRLSGPLCRNKKKTREINKSLFKIVSGGQSYGIQKRPIYRHPSFSGVYIGWQRGQIWTNFCQIFSGPKQFVHYFLGFLPLGRSISLYVLWSDQRIDSSIDKGPGLHGNLKIEFFFFFREKHYGEINFTKISLPIHRHNWPHQLYKILVKETIFNIWRNE